jgi:hypothetical protein
MKGLRRTRSKVPWWQWRPRRRYSIVAVVDAADEIPPRLPRRGIVVVRPDGVNATWAAFDCPCAGRDRILVSLDPNRRPRWQIEDGRGPTLHPSVDVVIDGRRCHFSIINGAIVWARDERGVPHE